MGKLINDPEFYNNLNGAAKDLRAADRRRPAEIREVLAGQVSLF